MSKCKLCKKELEDSTWTFCSKICNELNYHLVEKKIEMNHSFLPSALALFTCTKCGFDRNAHGPNAICESCGSVNSCNAIPDSLGKFSLLCNSCEEKNLLSHAETNNNSSELNKITNLEGIEFVQKDYTLRYRQDLYNAKIASIESLRSDSKDETEFITKLVSHYQILQTAIHENRVEQLAIAQKLHDIGALRRKEIREELRKNDENYKPEVSKKTIGPKLPGRAKMSPMERIVQTIALNKNITLDAARELLYKNPELMNLLDSK